MCEDNVGNMQIVVGIEGIKEDNAPECVQQYNGKRLNGRGDKEDFAATFQSHCAGSSLFDQSHISKCGNS